MKKAKIILASLALASLFIPNSVSALDKKITTCSASQANGTITVSGTAEEGALAVAIEVIDKSGNKKTETASVKEDKSFSYGIAMAEGEYTVKVADFDGGEYCTTTVTTTKNDTPTETTTDESKSTDETSAAQPDTGRVTAEGPSAVKVVSYSLIAVGVFTILVFAAVKFSKKEKK